MATKSTEKKETAKKTAEKSSAAKSTVKKTAAKPAVKKSAVKSPEKKNAAKIEGKKPAVKTTPKKTAETKKTVKAAAPVKAKKIEPKMQTEPAEVKSQAKVKMVKDHKKNSDNTESQNIVEIVSPKKVTKVIKGYSKKELENFRNIILAKREEIFEQLQNIKEQMMDPTTGQYVNENSPYSLHMAEQGTDAMEREKLFLWAQRETKCLGYLDEALVRIDKGTFGICLDCIDEPQGLCPTCPLVPKDRLEAVPHSQMCLPVKKKQEKK